MKDVRGRGSGPSHHPDCGSHMGASNGVDFWLKARSKSRSCRGSIRTPAGPLCVVTTANELGAARQDDLRDELTMDSEHEDPRAIDFSIP